MNDKEKNNTSNKFELHLETWGLEKQYDRTYRFLVPEISSMGMFQVRDQN